MSDEIYVNIGTTFQQPYQAQQPAIGQTPANVQAVRQAIANAQTPFTYQNRQPSTYRNPVNAQSPYIANAQQPYPHPVNANYPFIANAQTPYPYIANSQTPYIAQARQPSTYARQGRSPFTYSRQGQSPFTYQAQSPFTYQHRQPVIYQVNYQSRQPVIYQVSYQHPTTYQSRQPAYYRNPVSYRVPYIANAQYTAQQPASYQSPYIANKQSPYIANAQQTINYNYPVPSTYTYDQLIYTLSGTSGLTSNGYTYFMGFTDGTYVGLGVLGASPQSPTINALWTGSSKIMFWKSAPTYPALLTTNFFMQLQGPGNDLAANGYTKIKISSPTLSETTLPIPSIEVTNPNGMKFYPFPAPTYMTTGNQAFTMKFFK